jgi:hypothetical protein
VTEPEGYGDWRSLELAIKDAAKKAARMAGPGVSAATVDAQIRQARYDRFLSRVFARGEQSEWLLKGGLSMLARVPRARTTKDVDLAALHVGDLADAEAALTSLVAVNLSDHLTFRLVRSMPTGLGNNQPGVATRRYVFACFDVDTGNQIDTVTVDVVVGPSPVAPPEVVEPANRLHLRRPLVTHPYRLYPVADQLADKVCATMDTNYPGGKRSSRVKDLVDLVVLAHTQRVDLEQLRQAVQAKQLISKHRCVRPRRHPGRLDSHLPGDREGRPLRRVLHGPDRRGHRRIVRRPCARQELEHGHLGPAGWTLALLDTSAVSDPQLK